MYISDSQTLDESGFRGLSDDKCLKNQAKWMPKLNKLLCGQKENELINIIFEVVLSKNRGLGSFVDCILLLIKINFIFTFPYYKFNIKK